MRLNRFVTGTKLFFLLLASTVFLSFSLHAQSSTITITATGMQSLYTGVDGTVEYDWTMPLVGSVNSLGKVHVSAKLNNTDAEMDVPLSMQTAGGVFSFRSGQPTTAAGTYILLWTNGGATLTMTLRQAMTGKSLLTDVQSRQPSIVSVNFNLVAVSEPFAYVPVPYYTGSVLYLQNAGIFANAQFDWQSSNASQLVTAAAQYFQLTTGHLNPMKERLVLSASQNLPEVLPSVANIASRYLSELAGRLVIDIWSQKNFTQLSQALSSLQDYGVKNCVVLIHGWQANGYDNALPAQYPASSSQGGDPVLSQVMTTAKNMNCFVAVHENYVDYYPNYYGFTTNSVGRNSDGSLKLGWLNTSTNIQSYATKPNWFVPNATTQSPAIHAGLGTNAAFIDVNSASVPWMRVDMDSTQPGAGTISAAASENASLWGFEHRTHGGPVFGEGLDHWYWSGLLDGVEAQFGAGGNYSKAEKHPLLVDFDLFKMHPLQANHGMGLYERWLTSGESIRQTNLLDAYRMQEVIYGHAPYIEDPFWNDTAHVLLEQNLVSPVAQRYGKQTVTSIGYEVNGSWTDSNAATKAQDWSRVVANYANGDKIFANAQPQILNLGGLDVPQYGWLAVGTDLLAYTAMVGGNVADYSQTPTSFFANARNQADLAASGDVAQPSVQSVQSSGGRTFSINYQWRVLEGSGATNLNCFVHFVNPFTGATIFQGDHLLPSPSSAWLPGQLITDYQANMTLPSWIPDGSYSVRIGLYNGTLRYSLYGTNDGNQRYILGTLTLSNNGQSVSFTAQPAPALTPDSRLNGSGVVLDFTAIRTDGMVSLNQDAGNWTLRTYPRSRDVVVQLSNSYFPAPANITCDSNPATIIDTGAGYWQIHTNGAKSCQWPSQ